MISASLKYLFWTYLFYFCFAFLQSRAFLNILDLLNLKKQRSHNSRNITHLHFAFGYFGGISLTVFCLIILSFLGLKFYQSFYLMISLYLIVIIIRYYFFTKFNIKKLSKHTFQKFLALCLSIVFLLLLFSILDLCIWTFDGGYSEYSSPHSSFGSMESGRYGNIANSIIQNDRIPVLGQNYLQSIFAAFNPLSGVLMNLFVFLVINQTILFIFLFQYCKSFLKFSSLYSIITCCIFFFSSWSLFHEHIFIIDAASPFFITGYSDTLMSVGNFLVFYYFIQQKEKNLWLYFIIGLLAFGWSFFAPQNIIGGLLCIGILFVNKSFTSKQDSLFYLKLGIIAFLMICTSSMFGGMLAPSSLHTQQSIPGLLQTTEKMVPKIQISLNYLIFNSKIDGFSFSHASNLLFTTWSLNQIIIDIVTILRILFLPFLGLFTFFFYRRYERNHGYSILDFFKPGVWMFVFTFLFVLTFSFGEQKWPVSRFILPGVVLMILLLMKNIEVYFSNSRNIFAKSLIFLSITLMFIPTTQTIYFRYHYYFNANICSALVKLNTLRTYIGIKNKI